MLRTFVAYVAASDVSRIARHRGEVHDGVVGGLLGQVQLVEGRQPGERRVGLTGVGEVDPKVGDRRVPQRDEVGVGDVVALLGEVRRDVPAGLAAATGEEDAHGSLHTPKVLGKPHRHGPHGRSGIPSLRSTRIDEAIMAQVVSA